MTTKEIIATSITAIVLIIDLITDYKLRKKRINEILPTGAVDHNRGLWLRLIGLTPAIYFGWYRIVPLLLFLYWTLFDGLTNLLWGNNWFRLGTTPTLDKLQRKYPIITWGKYIGLIVSGLFYFWQRF